MNEERFCLGSNESSRLVVWYLRQPRGGCCGESVSLWAGDGAQALRAAVDPNPNDVVGRWRWVMLGSCVRAGGDGHAGGGLGATSRGAFHMLPADRKIFRLVRGLLWKAEVQRRLPAALRRRKERAVAEDGAEDGGLEEEADGSTVESLVLGALSSSPVHRALVLVLGTNIAVLHSPRVQFPADRKLLPF